MNNDRYDSWLTEKSMHVLEYLASLVDASRENPEYRESHLYGLDSALWDATKVVSYASGKAWSPHQRDIIRDFGSDGIEILKKYYGWITETRDDKLITELEKLKYSLSCDLKEMDKSRIRELVDKFNEKDSFTVGKLWRKLENSARSKEEWVKIVEEKDSYVEGLQYEIYLIKDRFSEYKLEG